MEILMNENVNPEHHEQIFKVTPEMIDDNHHFNNVWSVKWIQDIAIAHSEKCGGTAYMRELGAGWMVHTQHVEYKNQAFLGDEIKGTTWVDSCSRVVSIRRSRFERVSDGKVIFESETHWVLVDMKRGRPLAIPDKMKALYGISE